MCDLNIALITTSADTRLGIASTMETLLLWLSWCVRDATPPLTTRPLRLPKLMTSLWRCFARFLGWGNVTCDVTSFFCVSMVMCYNLNMIRKSKWTSQIRILTSKTWTLCWCFLGKVVFFSPPFGEESPIFSWSHQRSTFEILEI